MEPMDELHSRANEDSAQNECTEDSPKEHTVLQFVRNSEVIEDHEEDEEIINAQRQLDDITSDEFQAGLASLPKIQDNRKGSGLHNVHEAPGQSLTKLNNV